MAQGDELWLWIWNNVRQRYRGWVEINLAQVWVWIGWSYSSMSCSHEIMAQIGKPHKISHSCGSATRWAPSELDLGNRLCYLRILCGVIAIDTAVNQTGASNTTTFTEVWIPSFGFSPSPLLCINGKVSPLRQGRRRETLLAAHTLLCSLGKMH